MSTFFTREIWPRRDQLFFDGGAAASILLAGIATFSLNRWGHLWAVTIPTFGDLATGLIAFSAITFGGCVAGATLAVALPSGRTLSVLAINGDDGPPRRLLAKGKKLVAVNATDDSPVKPEDFPKRFRSRYKDLVFLFVYSAYVQLALLGVALCILLVHGDQPLYGCGCSWWLASSLASLLAIALYSLSALLSCLKALFNLGEIRDSSIRGSAVEGTSTEFEP